MPDVVPEIVFGVLRFERQSDALLLGEFLDGDGSLGLPVPSEQLFEDFHDEYVLWRLLSPPSRFQVSEAAG